MNAPAPAWIGFNEAPAYMHRGSGASSRGGKRSGISFNEAPAYMHRGRPT